MADVLIIKGSTRAKGNTDALADAAAEGAASAGHRVTTLVLREHRFSGCIACGGCSRDGFCHVKDAMQDIFTLLDAAEHVVLAAPMFFMSLPWCVKSMIDRCQVYWARKYVLKTGSGRAHPGGNCLALLLGGTDYRTLFDAPRIVLGAWTSIIEMTLHLGLTLRKIDAKGDIEKHPDALGRARDLGARIAIGDKS